MSAVFHVGLAIILLAGAPHILLIHQLTGITWPSLPKGWIVLASGVTLAAMIALLIRRIGHPVLRLLSTTDDYLSWLLVFLPVLTGDPALGRDHRQLRDPSLPAYPERGADDDLAALRQADAFPARVRRARGDGRELRPQGSRNMKPPAPAPTVPDAGSVAKAMRNFIADIGPDGGAGFGVLRALRTLRGGMQILRANLGPALPRRSQDRAVQASYEREIGPFAFAYRLVGLAPKVTGEELESWQELIYDSCNMCGRCSLICPMGIDIADLVEQARHGMFEAGLAPADYLGAIAEKEHATGKSVRAVDFPSSRTCCTTSAPSITSPCAWTRRRPTSSRPYRRST
ncbi:MAG: hypothetical protein WDN49_04755 [Acetobacteraceae bacterium]